MMYRRNPTVKPEPTVTAIQRGSPFQYPNSAAVLSSRLFVQYFGVYRKQVTPKLSFSHESLTWSEKLRKTTPTKPMIQPNKPARKTILQNLPDHAHTLNQQQKHNPEQNETHRYSRPNPPGKGKSPSTPLFTFLM
jgi:hypothetical protein